MIESAGGAYMGAMELTRTTHLIAEVWLYSVIPLLAARIRDGHIEISCQMTSRE